MIVGIETSDDAAIYKVTDDIAMIQTVDFFTPIVDDPYMFGQIAAANSLSDVYAMGGEPKVALNIVGFPNCLDPQILGDILAGGADKVKEAGAVLVGGHTVQDDEPKYGLCVSGFVHPKKIFKNYGCKPGDVLILTKQVGTGIVNTAIKGEMASAAAIREAACTDITGFGLLGHCVEMAEASNVTFELNVHDIAYLDEAISYAKMGLVPAGAYKNKGYSYQKVDFRNVEDHFIDLLYDPQTSGGLLISVEAQYAEAVMEAFEKKRLDTKVSLIGTVTEKSDKLIRLH